MTTYLSSTNKPSSTVSSSMEGPISIPVIKSPKNQMKIIKSTMSRINAMTPDGQTTSKRNEKIAPMKPPASAKKNFRQPSSMPTTNLQQKLAGIGSEQFLIGSLRD